MSVGGIFSLITNDGKQDRMLMATGLLNARLKAIEVSRSQNPRIRDPTPTLVDIEKTHILFVNAHFKPFAAIGYEYNRVSPQSGNNQLGGTVEFSIPQFGDFFNDMALHVVLDAVSAPNAAYWSNPSNGFTGQELIRYVDYPGQRLCEHTEFRVNGNPLDRYDQEVLTLHRDFRVQPNKEVGWARNVGQQVPRSGYLDVSSNGTSVGLSAGVGMQQVVSVVDGHQTPKATQEALEMWIPLLFWFNLDPRLSIPSVAIPYGQRFIDVTLATAQNMLQCLPAYGDVTSSTLLPYTGTVTMSTCELYINNIFVNPEIHDLFIKRIGFNLVRVHRQQAQKVSTDTNSILLSQFKWPVETIYVGCQPVANGDNLNQNYPQTWHLFGKQVNQSVGLCPIHKYNIAATYISAGSSAADPAGGADLAYRGQSAGSPAGVGTAATASQIVANAYLDTLNDQYVTLNIASAGLYIIDSYSYDDLSAALVPIDGTSLDLAALINALGWTAVTGTNVASMNLVNSALKYLGYPTIGSANNAKGILEAVGYANYTNEGVNCTASVLKSYPVIETLQVEAHGIPLYKYSPGSFFNAYIPYTYGSHNIRTPDDNAVLQINFCLYPGSYQPSGHINISRAREFYINFTTSQYPAYSGGVATMTDIVSSTTPATFIAVAIAINFLLISDGSAILRYST